jgi:hypothetical protein
MSLTAYYTFYLNTVGVIQPRKDYYFSSGIPSCVCVCPILWFVFPVGVSRLIIIRYINPFIFLLPYDINKSILLNCSSIVYSLTKRYDHCQWRTAHCTPISGAFDHSARKDLYCVTGNVTHALPKAKTIVFTVPRSTLFFHYDPKTFYWKIYSILEILSSPGTKWDNIIN